MHLIQKPHFLEILSNYGLYTAFKIRYLIDRERVRKNDHKMCIRDSYESGGFSGSGSERMPGGRLQHTERAFAGNV